jgi:VIT1/CCC1 family predicted Fe2+/Mn2+ transporter
MNQPPRAEHSHSPDDIARRLQTVTTHGYLRDYIYGAIDGAVTTFAVVSGVAGAGLPTGIVIVMGVANLVGDGFSMAAGNYLGTRADQQLREKARKMEERHIIHFPEGEREEIRQIFAQKGFSGTDLNRAVDIITADVRQWVDTMLTDELGIPLDGPSPGRAATTTFAAFISVGLLPLVAFIVEFFAPELVTNPYTCSTIITGFTFFGVGAAKSRFVDQAWYWAGSETLLVGGSAAALAFWIGRLLAGVVPI